MKILPFLSALLVIPPLHLSSTDIPSNPRLQQAIEGRNGVTEVSPVEDLMREHGVLRQILLIYDEINRRLSTKTPFASKLLKDSSMIVQKFIEDYHEKLEEDFIFPRLEKREEMKELVKTLLEQHQRGRQLTAYIIQHATDSDLEDKETCKKIQECISRFVIMYRPHAAREDTVAFPAFKTTITDHEYLYLGDVFENKETEMFGEDGFTKIVADVATIEKALGIYTLERFTPPSLSLPKTPASK